MQQPHLVVMEKAGTIPIKGGCSVCPSVTFEVEVSPATEQPTLEDLFDEHLRKVHLRNAPDS